MHKCIAILYLIASSYVQYTVVNLKSPRYQCNALALPTVEWVRLKWTLKKAHGQWDKWNRNTVDLRVLFNLPLYCGLKIAILDENSFFYTFSVCLVVIFFLFKMAYNCVSPNSSFFRSSEACWYTEIHELCAKNLKKPSFYHFMTEEIIKIKCHYPT